MVGSMWQHQGCNGQDQPAPGRYLLPTLYRALPHHVHLLCMAYQGADIYPGRLPWYGSTGGIGKHCFGLPLPQTIRRTSTSLVDEKVGTPPPDTAIQHHRFHHRQHHLHGIATHPQDWQIHHRLIFYTPPAMAKAKSIGVIVFLWV